MSLYTGMYIMTSGTFRCIQEYGLYQENIPVWNLELNNVMAQAIQKVQHKLTAVDFVTFEFNYGVKKIRPRIFDYREHLYYKL